ncbi:hypothetical protein H8Z60_23690 [Mycolicibacterium fortuitum]|jgi:hypothetical protein|nr:hypothetical protein [Mycolicibacterium fortuitum]
MIAMILSIVLTVGCSNGSGVKQSDKPPSPENKSTQEIVKSTDDNQPEEVNSKSEEELSEIGQLYGSNVMYSIKVYLEKPIVPEDLRIKISDSIEYGYDWYRKKDISDFKALAKHIKNDDRDRVKEIYDKLILTYPPKKAEEPEKDSESETTVSSAEPILLSGKGDSATDSFSLKPGIAIFESSYTGESNFIVHLFNSDGDRVKGVVNTIGTYKGKTLVVIDEEDEFMLNVKSDGKWEISIVQSAPSDIKSSPTKFSGSGDDVLFVNLDAKLTKFSFTHSGESNFIVRINDQKSLANEIGEYNGSVAQKISDPGVYVLSVKSEGEWTIDID